MAKIYLVGFMGCGKSTFGASLARAMNLDFHDLDQGICQEYGKSIRELMEEGEPLFRVKERDILLRTATMDHVVIATGGGTPCFYNNMEWMTEQGLTVFLKVHPASLEKRLLEEKDSRPLLDGLSEKNLSDYIHSKRTERGPFYNRACITLEASDQTVAPLLSILAAALRYSTRLLPYPSV
jgi:shikimate kinase